MTEKPRYETVEKDTLRVTEELPADWRGVDRHVHLRTLETIRVIEGELRVLLPTEAIVLTAGERLRILPEMVHTMNTRELGPARVEVEFTPAGSMEPFLKGLAHARRHGRSVRLQTAIMRSLQPDFFAANRPIWIQRLSYWMLAPVAWLVGYRRSY